MDAILVVLGAMVIGGACATVGLLVIVANKFRRARIIARRTVESVVDQI